jgi:DNA-directed RNA polymerase subunit RPC12/RpoP
LDATLCPKCQTTLDEAGSCVTCAAAAEGLVRVWCMDFGTIRDAMARLEEAGLGPEMEQVPAATPTEARRPRWNLYVPTERLEAARQCLTRDWTVLVEGDEAVQAALRGEEVLALDGEAEIACPACGHRFKPAGREAECPDCGLGLGVPGESE